LKRIVTIVVTIAALAVSAPAVAAPPQSTANPLTNYLVTRVLPNKSEVVLDTFLVTSWDSQEQAIRATALQYATLQRTNNPSWRVVLYGPIDPPSTYWTDDDRIWDSTTNF